MKKLIFKPFVALLLTGAIITSAAVQATATPNLAQVLQRDGRFTTLLAALDASGLTPTVASGGTFTVFAPTDAAFAALPPGTVESLLANKPALTKVLLYHVLGGRQNSEHLLQTNTPVTLEGDPVIVVRDGRRVTVDGRNVVQANRWAANGLIHVIDGVLLPPTQSIQIRSIVDVLELDGRFTTLLTALELTGLKNTVATGGVFTLFAPTDAAFNALPPGTVASLVTNIPALTQILLYHAVAGSVSTRQLLKEGSFATVEGSAVRVSLNDWNVYLNNARIVNRNVRAPNGFIDVIDQVLLPPPPTPNLLALLEADGRFTTLLTALDLAGLSHTVQTGGPFTVFAPTDEAFAALPPGALSSLIAHPDALRQVLLYHVVSGEKNARELLKERKVPTIDGADVFVRLGWDRNVYVNRARVIDADVAASNGIAHVIGGVLLPPAGHEDSNDED
jgi:transforming growth factor-beta-induced protein